MKILILIALLSGLLAGCAGSKQKLQILSEVKNTSKTICITNPFIYLEALNTKGSYFDGENQKKMVGFITTEAKDNLQKQFEVFTNINPVDSLYFKFGDQLYQYMIRLDKKREWSQVEMPPLVKDEIDKSYCDLNLFIFNYAFYRTKSNMARGVAGSVALGVLTLGSATVVPLKSLSKMYVAVYSKEKNSVVYFDNEEDSDTPTEEKYAKEQINTLLEDFVKIPKNVLSN